MKDRQNLVLVGPWRQSKWQFTYLALRQGQFDSFLVMPEVMPEHRTRNNC